MSYCLLSLSSILTLSTFFYLSFSLALSISLSLTLFVFTLSLNLSLSWFISLLSTNIIKHVKIRVLPFLSYFISTYYLLYLSFIFPTLLVFRFATALCQFCAIMIIVMKQGYNRLTISSPKKCKFPFF